MGSMQRVFAFYKQVFERLTMSEIREKIIALKQYLQQNIVGQEMLLQKLIITMLADGHALVEGAPGLAKTKAIKKLSDCIEGTFNRIQFTPDLLPSDITGSEIYVVSTGHFEFRSGPIFANMVLADEINRAPAKVQSALLEAMAERQVSIGGKQYKLPRLFMVMATQNPIEHEGTYNLPEAQLDRFLMYIKIDQPNVDVERRILNLVRNEAMEEYLVQLIMATRHPEKYDANLKNALSYGASPRATIALDKCAKINAWLAGRNYVTPEDIHSLVFDVLRHRIILSFEAQANGMTADDVIARLLKLVPLP